MRLGLLPSIILIISALFLAHNSKAYLDLYKGKDFVPAFTGTKCLLANCNPYSSADLEKQYLRAGGPAQDPKFWTDEVPMYPPAILLALLPFAFVSYPAANLIWFVINLLLLTGAAVAIVAVTPPRFRLLASIVAGTVLATSGYAVGLAQPAVSAVALATVATCCIISGRRVAAIVCFVLALAIKSQIGLPILLYFLFVRAHRRTAWQTLAVWAGLSVLAALWVTFFTPAETHWVQDLRNNIEVSTRPGAVNNPVPNSVFNPEDFLNLQAATTVLTTRPINYNLPVWAITAVLSALWLIAVLRMPASNVKNWLALAGISCLALLPVYHRIYDDRLLFLTVPALVILLMKDRVYGAIAMLVSFQLLAFHAFFAHVGREILESKLALSTHSNALMTILFWRSRPLCLLLTSIIYVGYFFYVSRSNGRAQQLEA